MRKDSNHLGLLNPGEDTVMEGGILLLGSPRNRGLRPSSPRIKSYLSASVEGNVVEYYTMALGDNDLWRHFI
jgi:hypothetical protein